LNLTYDLLAIATHRPYRFVDDVVSHRIQVFETEVLKLMVDGIDTKAIRDRRINIYRFQCYALTLFRTHDIQRLHVMEAVSEFDQYHSHILCHRQQHLTEILCLRLRSTLEFNLVQFGQSVDQFSDLLTKAIADILFGDT